MSTGLYTSKAEWYAAAFDWPADHQVDAIADFSGLEHGRVMEPMCGHARLLRAFAQAGFDTVGIDQSAQLLDIARKGFEAESLAGQWHQADVTDFVLDEACDLAVCPVNSLAHLQTDADMGRHLRSMSANLYSGASYWVQLDLKAAQVVDEGEDWEFELEGIPYQCEWSVVGVDGDFETHQTRFLDDGEEIFAQRDTMRRWTFDAWTAVLDVSAFDLVGAYDGNSFEPFATDRSLETRSVFWQQLVKTH